tara:strand:- start:1378 stop:1851 length:474 start_codon:yes stop_codon:yes gene_type:complete
MKYFVYWWLSVCLFLTGGYFAWDLGFFEFLALADITRLSFIILFLLSLCTISTGSIIYKLIRTGGKYIENSILRFFADNFTGLGLVGTVIGFMYTFWMLAPLFSGFDPSNIIAAQEIFKILLIGTSTALSTTLVGVISSIFLNFQLELQEKVYELYI